MARSQLTAGIYCDSILFQLASGTATDKINQHKNKKLSQIKNFQSNPAKIILVSITSIHFYCLYSIYNVYRKQKHAETKVLSNT